MPVYIGLIRFTERGAKNFRKSPDRAAAFAAATEKAGAKILAQYWTLGEYDGVIVLDAPDDETATSLMLSLTSLGNVRTTTLRAFTAAEMKAVVAKASKLQR